MSLDPSLPISNGRATQGVSAPNGTSVSQGGVSGFDALMAVLGPETGTNAPAEDSAPATGTPAVQAGMGAVPPAPAQTTPVLPQLVEDAQAVAPAPAAAVVPGDSGAPDAGNATASAPADNTPIQLSAAPVETLPVPPSAQDETKPVTRDAASKPASSSRPAPAEKPRAASEDAVQIAATVATPAQVDANAAAVTAAVAAQLPSQVPTPPPAPAGTQAATKPASSALAANMPPLPLAAVPAGAAPVATASGDSPVGGDVKTPSRITADDAGASASAPQAADTPVAAPLQTGPRPDTVATTLKTMRKALTDDAAVAADAAPAVRAAAPSGFSLQPSQAEAMGAYTATGAQTAGMTEGGSNLSRATVETLSAMAVQVNRKLSEGNTKFAVELHPADLGKVEVTLTIARDGTTTAHLKFDTPVTAAAFQAQEGQLRHQLAQTGLSLDSGSLTFSSRDDGNGGGFSQAFAQSQQQGQSSQNRQSQAQARAFQSAATVAADADTSAASAIDAGLLALRGGASSTLALNLIV